jgi:hypothetical protein
MASDLERRIDSLTERLARIAAELERRGPRPPGKSQPTSGLSLVVDNSKRKAA